MLSKITISTTLSLLLLVCSNGHTEKLESEDNYVAPPNYEHEISIMFGGDVMFHQPQIDAALDGANGYNFTKTFQYIQDSWQGCDAVIFNLETTLSDKNYSGYPQFAAPKEVARDLKECGVTHLMLANNHVCDKHFTGIEKTAKYLAEAGIESAGCYVDSAALKLNSPLRIKKEGFDIAVFNYTYGTNGIDVPNGAIVPHLDTALIAKDIARAKQDSVTNIVVFAHWGNEYQSQPCKEQTQLAQWLHDKGVDIVIGSHPHVIQPTYVDSCGVTVYSLGNLVSNQRKRYTNGGLLVKLDMVRNSQSGECSYKLTHHPHFVYKAPLGDTPRYYCTPEILIDSIVKESAQRAEAELFFSDTKTLLQLE